MTPTARTRPWLRLSAAAATLGLLTACTSAATPSDTDPAQDGAGSGLLDDTVVHELDIEFDETAYDAMISTFTSTGEKEWITATVSVDGQLFHDVGLRLKGNSSLSGLRGGAAAQRAGEDGTDDADGSGTDDADGSGNDDADAAAGEGEAADQGEAADEGAAVDRVRPGGAGGPGGGATADEPESLPWLVRLDEFVEGQSYDGLTEFVIRSNSSETSLNEAVALELVGLAGLATQEAASTRLTVNGSEEQLRLVVENPGDEWDDRVFATEGILYKAEAGGDYSYRGDDPTAYEDVFDQETGDEDDLTPLMDFLEFVNDADDETFAAELGTHLDVAAFADYLAVQELIGNFDDIDGPGNNSYLRYDSATGRFTVVTWDLNLAFGGLGGGTGGAFPGDRQRPEGAGTLPEDLPEGVEPFPGGPPDGVGTLPEDLPEGVEPPAGGVDRGAFPGGLAGGPGGGNVLAERFMAEPTFAAQYEASLTRLRAELYDSGAAQDVLDRWSTLLTDDATVDADVVAQEAAAIASHFMQPSASADPEPSTPATEQPARDDV